MALVALEIPPGFHRNGTDLDAAGRWRDGTLVRWRNGSLRPVGGWRTFGDATLNAAPRGALSWSSNDGSREAAFGTYNKLYHLSGAGVVSDITPAGFVSGFEDAGENYGYGGGAFGAGAFGVAREDDGIFVPATTWSMASWGEYLLACSPDDGKIYEWQLDTGTLPTALTNAPTSCAGVMVTDERFVFALGAGSDPRKVQWSDRENNTSWAPSSTNEAGDIILEGAGEIMCGLRARGQSVILTDADAWTATYQGPPFVYGFSRVADDCGVISRGAAASAGDFIFWMGRNEFFAFNGSVVEAVPCDVADFVFSEMNTDQKSKVQAVCNSAHGEVWWFFPSSSSTECDRYVAYDYREGHWMIGSIDRTCGVDLNPARYPIWVDSSGQIYQHEVGGAHGSEVAYAETGPLQLGNEVFTANRMIPDEGTQGEVTATFKTRLYPNASEASFGPFTMSNPTSIRFTGRQARMRVAAVGDADWRVGTMRLDVKPRGER